MANANRMLKLIYIPLVLFILIAAAFFVCIFRYDLIIGILGVFFFGFYGITMSAVFAFERGRTLRMALLVQKMGTTTFKVLAQNSGYPLKQVEEKVAWCISHGYLPDFVISDEWVINITDESKQEHAVECPNCGASFKYLGKIGQCPYCGDYYPPRNKKV